MSWQNHSTWPRLDMSGLPWTSDHLAFFVNTIVIVRRIIKVHISYNYAFSLNRKWLSSKLQKIEKKIFTCLASSNSGSLTESARYSTFFQKRFFHHIFEGKILMNTKKRVKFSISDRRSSRGMESGEDMNTKCQYLSSHPCHEYFYRQIKNNIIIIAHIFKTADKVVHPVQMPILSGSIGAGKNADAVGRFDNRDLCMIILF